MRMGPSGSCGQYYNRVMIIATIVIQKSYNVLLINNSVRGDDRNTVIVLATASVSFKFSSPKVYLV